MHLKFVVAALVFISALNGAGAQALSTENLANRCGGIASLDLSKTENKILLMMDAAALEAFGKNYGLLVKGYTGLNISASDLLLAQKAFFNGNETQINSILDNYGQKGDTQKFEKFYEISSTVLKTTAFLKRMAKEFYTQDNYRKTLSLLNEAKVQVIKAIEPQMSDKKLFKKTASAIQNAKLAWFDEKTISKNSQIDEQFGVSVVTWELLESHPMLSTLMEDPSALFRGNAANVPQEEVDHYAIAIMPPFFQIVDEGTILILAHELGHVLSNDLLTTTGYKNRIMSYGTCALRSSYPKMGKEGFEDLIVFKAGELIADAVATWTIQAKGPAFSSQASKLFCAKASDAPWEDNIDDEHPGVRIRVETLFTGKCKL